MSEFIFIIKLLDNLYNPYNLEAMMPFVSIPLREYQSAMQAGLPAAEALCEPCSNRTKRQTISLGGKNAWKDLAQS